MANKEALFFCTELSDYFHNCILTFANTFEIHCHVVCLSKTSFILPNHSKIICYEKSNFHLDTFFTFFLALTPVVIFTAGWIDPDYLKITTQFRKRNIPVLLGLDNHWENSLKQKIGVVIKKKIIQKAASHIWIPGTPQLKFAHELGFLQNKIVTGLYAANQDLFKKGYTSGKVFHNILFVGRLVDYKRPVELFETFKTLSKESKRDWTLTIIGSGNCRSRLKETENIRIHDFLQPKEIIEHAKSASVFCLPSTKEHWGVAVQEFCAAGKLLLLSDGVGAASEFLEHNYNGFEFKSNKIYQLKHYLNKIMAMSDDEIETFQKRSYKLATKMTPDDWAYKLHDISLKIS